MKDTQIERIDKEIIAFEEQRQADYDKYVKPWEIKLKELKQKKAEFLCPFKVGDVVVSERGGRRVRVTKISLSYTWDYQYLLAYGLRIKKDGSEGAETRLYTWDNWRKA